MRLARHQVLRCFAIANSRAAELLAEPGDAHPDYGENDGLEDPGLVNLSLLTRSEPKMRLRAVASSPGRSPPRPAASRTAGMKRTKMHWYSSHGCRPERPSSSSPTAPAAVQ